MMEITDDDDDDYDNNDDDDENDDEKIYSDNDDFTNATIQNRHSPLNLDWIDVDSESESVVVNGPLQILRCHAKNTRLVRRLPEEEWIAALQL